MSGGGDICLVVSWHYKRFSERIRDTLSEYKKSRDENLCFSNNAETSKAYRPNADDNFDEAIDLLADKINTPIKSFARVDWCLSTAIHKK